MKDYNFTSLNPRVFECLARDLIQRKIANEERTHFVFNSFSEGADNGIDALYTDDKRTIILQAKRYKDFRSLFRQLSQTEFAKVQRLNPNRYILVTSLSLSQQQFDKLESLFGRWIKDSSDIVGSDMLNNLLGLYPDIELNYPQLYLKTPAALSRLLNTSTYNQSEAKLVSFQKQVDTYVPNDSLRQAIQLLRKNRYVLIAGDPGVGKTTLAGMLSLYYLEHDYQFVFIRNEVNEGWNLLDRNIKQVFLFDDFLGRTSFDSGGFNRNEDQSLLDFMKEINRSTNKILIVTTRSYVFSQAVEKYPELKHMNYEGCVISQGSFTPAFKIHVLYNYLYHSDLDWKHLHTLTDKYFYDSIIHHRHFTPRIIRDFLEQRFDKNDNSYAVFHKLKSYLDDPFAYWDDIFRKLSENARTLLLVMVITHQPGIEDILFETFCRLNSYRKTADPINYKDHFLIAIKELDESFVVVHPNDVRIALNQDEQIALFESEGKFRLYRLSNSIEFLNPSIKDYMLHYLKNRNDLINCLLMSTVCFNQLVEIFKTRESNGDNELSFFRPGEQILLNGELQQLVAKRIIEEFDTLSFLTIESYEIEDEKYVDYLNPNLDNRMAKLLGLLDNFPDNKEVIEFVRKKYIALTCYPEYLSLKERLYQADVIESLHQYVPFDADEVFESYYKEIRFAEEFIELYNLGKLFPGPFRKHIIENLPEVRKTIKELIREDIAEYDIQSSFDPAGTNNLEELLYSHSSQLAKLYGFKLTDRFKRSVNEEIGRNIYRIKNDEESSSNEYEFENDEDYLEAPDEAKQKSMQEFKTYEVALTQLRPYRHDFKNDSEMIEYLRSTLNDELLFPRFFNILKHHSEKGIHFSNSPEIVDLVVKKYDCFLSEYDNESELIHRLFANFDPELFSTIGKVASYLFLQESFIFRRKSLIKALQHCGIDNEDAFIDFLCDQLLLIEEDPWLRFNDYCLQVFFAAYDLSKQPVSERLKIYQLFASDYDNWPAEYCEIFFRYCLEMDKTLFKNTFLLTVIRNERNAVKNNHYMFLRNNSIKIDYRWDAEEKVFMVQSGSGGDTMIEDVLRLLDCEISSIMWAIEDCFNLSSATDPFIIEYIRKNVMLNKEKYTIDITMLATNIGTQALLESSGAMLIVKQYERMLEDLITKLEEDI